MCKGELGKDFKLEMGIGVNLNAKKEEYTNLPDGSSLFVETGRTVSVIDFFWRLSDKLVKNMSILEH